MSMGLPEQAIGAPFSQAYVDQLLLNPEKESAIEHFAGMEIRQYLHGGMDVYSNESGLIISLFFFNQGVEGHDRYGGILPSRLSFDYTISDVETHLGEPTRKGVNQASGAPWVRYDYEEHCVHIEFSSKTAPINKVTLMSPQAARGEV